MVPQCQRHLHVHRLLTAPPALGLPADRQSCPAASTPRRSAGAKRFCGADLAFPA